MDLLGQLFHRGRNISDVFNINRSKALKSQEKTLKKLLFNARKTEYGLKYDFESLLISKNVVKAFMKKLPITDYSVMHDWWQREFKGEENITSPGKTKYFALSSGTSNGSSKYIPVNEKGLRAMMKASRRELFAIFKTDVPKDFFTKDYLTLSGCTQLEYNGHNFYGDVSGIMAANMPRLLGRFAIPGEAISGQKDWHKKLDMIVNRAPDWDVVMIAGAPAWVKLLLEQILAKYKISNIHEIWPNLCVFGWGAVSIVPYKNRLDSMFGKPVKYFESYMASEAFVAFQTHENSKGLKLVFRNNTYFEFVPFNDKNFSEDGELLPGAMALTLADVEADKEYVILVTTCSGSWRYMIGDTIKFVDVENCEIKVTGRVKQFLSLCGEHLSVDNMNEGIRRTSEELGMNIPEYTVKGYKNGNELGHVWYLACDHAISPSKIAGVLDRHLCALNDDYAVERKHVLTGLKLEIFPESVFINWMDKLGKMGGQSKFPRVLPDSLYSDWVSYLEQLGVTQ